MEKAYKQWKKMKVKQQKTNSYGIYKTRYHSCS